MAQAIVFFDIAGPDDAALRNFYSSVFGWEPDQAGQSGVPVTTPIKGAIRTDPAGNPMGLVEMDGDIPRIP